MITATLPRVGDFLASSWGYDQTNVDFYRVLEVTPSGKSVRVQQWSSRIVRDDGPQVYVVPGDQPATRPDYSPGAEPGATLPARITLHRWQDGVTLDSCSSASPWNGRPMYQSGHGFGH